VALLPFLAGTPPPCSAQAASKAQEYQHQVHAVPWFEMSDGAWPSPVVTVFESLKVGKKEGGLLCCMDMAKQLLHGGWQGPLCAHSVASVRNARRRECGFAA
jgi:hypothetical protein